MSVLGAAGAASRDAVNPVLVAASGDPVGRDGDEPARGIKRDPVLESHNTVAERVIHDHPCHSPTVMLARSIAITGRQLKRLFLLSSAEERFTWTLCAVSSPTVATKPAVIQEQHMVKHHDVRRHAASPPIDDAHAHMRYKAVPPRRTNGTRNARVRFVSADVDRCRAEAEGA